MGEQNLDIQRNCFDRTQDWTQDQLKWMTSINYHYAKLEYFFNRIYIIYHHQYSRKASSQKSLSPNLGCILMAAYLNAFT